MRHLAAAESVVFDAINCGMARYRASDPCASGQPDHCADGYYSTSAQSTKVEPTAGIGTSSCRCADSCASSGAYSSEDESIAKAVAFIQQSHAHHIFSLNQDIAAALSQLQRFVGGRGKRCLVLPEICFDNFDFLTGVQRVQRAPGILGGLGVREKRRSQ
jgi:hypothetical protein